MEIVLLIILLIFIYQVGKSQGIEDTLRKVKERVEMTKDLEDFLKMMAQDWDEHDL